MLLTCDKPTHSQATGCTVYETVSLKWDLDKMCVWAVSVSMNHADAQQSILLTSKAIKIK